MVREGQPIFPVVSRGARPQSVSLGTWDMGWDFTVRQSQCHFDFSFFAFEANNGLFLFPIT